MNKEYIDKLPNELGPIIKEDQLHMLFQMLNSKETSEIIDAKILLKMDDISKLDKTTRSDTYHEMLIELFNKKTESDDSDDVII